jgi:hypothetical protein
VRVESLGIFVDAWTFRQGPERADRSLAFVARASLSSAELRSGAASARLASTEIGLAADGTPGEPAAQVTLPRGLDLEDVAIVTTSGAWTVALEGGSLRLPSLSVRGWDKLVAQVPDFTAGPTRVHAQGGASEIVATLDAAKVSLAAPLQVSVFHMGAVAVPAFQVSGTLSAKVLEKGALQLDLPRSALDVAFDPKGNPTLHAAAAGRIVVPGAPGVNFHIQKLDLVSTPNGGVDLLAFQAEADASIAEVQEHIRQAIGEVPIDFEFDLPPNEKYRNLKVVDVQPQLNPSPVARAGLVVGGSAAIRAEKVVWGVVGIKHVPITIRVPVVVGQGFKRKIVWEERQIGTRPVPELGWKHEGDPIIARGAVSGDAQLALTSLREGLHVRLAALQFDQISAFGVPLPAEVVTVIAQKVAQWKHVQFERTIPVVPASVLERQPMLDKIRVTGLSIRRLAGDRISVEVTGR